MTKSAATATGINDTQGLPPFMGKADIALHANFRRVILGAYLKSARQP